MGGDAKHVKWQGQERHNCEKQGLVMRSGLMVVLAMALVAYPAGAQVREAELTVSFGLRTTALHSEQRVDLSSMVSGLVPILTPGWSCAWSRGKQQLIVECFPRDQDQGVTIRAWCSDQTPSGDVAMVHLSTHDDANINPATEVIASCYSR